MRVPYFYYAAGENLSHVLPKRAAYFLANIIADVYANTSSKDSKAIQANLKEALPLVRTDKELKNQSKKLIKNYARYLVDLLYSYKLSREFIQKNVEMEGFEILEAELSKKKGVILASGHFGNWEMGAMILAKSGFPLSAIALQHQDPRVNEVFQKRRSKNGLQIIFFGNSLKSAYKVLSKNGILALNADSLYGDKGVPVHFMNKEVFFPQGISRISEMTGAPVLPVFFVTKGCNRYSVGIQKPLVSSDGKSLVQDFALRLEQMIRLYPTQWFVFNRFWERPEWPI